MIIYKATNIINNKVYIGQTVKSLNRRRSQHESIANKGNGAYFSSAIRKYGKENFEWEILCKTDSESKLNTLEKFYIACYKTLTELYNLTDGGEGSTGWKHTEKSYANMMQWHKTHDNPLLGKTLSEGTKKKVSKSLKKYYKEHPEAIENFKGENNPRYGKKASKELREKLSEAHKGVKLSEKHRIRISEALKDKKRPEEIKIKISEGLKKYWKNKRAGLL
jgi:group I intron endonuclease